jgi:hypothetical protein
MLDTTVKVTSASPSYVSAQKDFGSLDDMKNENPWFKDARNRPLFQALLSSRCFLFSTIIGLVTSVWSTVFFFVFMCRSPRNELASLLSAGETVWESEAEDDYFMMQNQNVAILEKVPFIHWSSLILHNIFSMTSGLQPFLLLLLSKCFY